MESQGSYSPLSTTSTSTDNAAQGAKYVPILPDPFWDIAWNDCASEAASLSSSDTGTSHHSESPIPPGWTVHYDNALRYLYHPGHRTVIEYPAGMDILDEIDETTEVYVPYLWQQLKDVIEAQDNAGTTASSVGEPGERPLRQDSEAKDMGGSSSPGPGLEEYELFLRRDAQTNTVYYYFVSYIFTLDDEFFPVFWPCGETLPRSLNKAMPGAEHIDIEYLLKFEFWGHVTRFPCHREVPAKTLQIQDLRGLVCNQAVDSSVPDPYEQSVQDLKDAKENVLKAGAAVEDVREGKEAWERVCVARCWRCVYKLRTHRRGKVDWPTPEPVPEDSDSEECDSTSTAGLFSGLRNSFISLIAG